MSISVQCAACVHKRTGPVCAAFPGLHRNAVGEFVEAPTIPSAIYTGDFDHRLPYEGDNGIRFEPEPDFANVWAEIPIENDAD